jgi:hypothetical protein
MLKKTLIQKLAELKEGQPDGGFIVIKTNALIVGGVDDPANNCKEGVCTNNCNTGNCGNCVKGCGVQ